MISLRNVVTLLVPGLAFLFVTLMLAMVLVGN